jgi:hypothetical protein
MARRSALAAREISRRRDYPKWIIVDTRTGRTLGDLDSPVLSPNSTRFATTADGWDNCSEANGPLVEVWRMTDSLPVREWHLQPFDCAHVPPLP